MIFEVFPVYACTFKNFLYLCIKYRLIVVIRLSPLHARGRRKRELRLLKTAKIQRASVEVPV